MKWYRLQTALPQMDNGWRSKSRRSSPLSSDLIRRHPRTALAAVLIGVRGKQIVLLEWDGMEWNDFAERELPSCHSVFESVLVSLLGALSSNLRQVSVPLFIILLSVRFFKWFDRTNSFLWFENWHKRSRSVPCLSSPLYSHSVVGRSLH